MDNVERNGQTDREDKIRKQVHRQAEFYRHLIIYVVVISALWTINAVMRYPNWQGGNIYKWWAFWPTFGWGIGIVSHGFSAFWKGLFSYDWEERKVQEILKKHDR